MLGTAGVTTGATLGTAGDTIGAKVGVRVGPSDGVEDVPLISADDGAAVGDRVGAAVGAADGPLGAKVGAGDGEIVGIKLGGDDAAAADTFEAAVPYRTPAHIATATQPATDAPMRNLYSQRNFGFATCESKSTSITPTIVDVFGGDCCHFWF